MLGLVAEAGGDSQSAIEHFCRAIGLGPRLAEAHFNLGVILQKQGLWREAAAAYQRAIAARADFPDCAQ